MRNRDDFSAKVKETLAKRVGYLCSNPQCSTPTTGPHSDQQRSLTLGVAAHITAASPGGPRYDPTLTALQRTSIDNGIWTCVRCSVLVDKDPSPYTVATLRRWKSTAERRAHEGMLKTKQ